MAVAGGQLAFGLTDTDDALSEVEKGMPVVIVYPDQGPAGWARCSFPTRWRSSAAPHPEAARELVDYLLVARGGNDVGRRPRAPKSR